MKRLGKLLILFSLFSCNVLLDTDNSVTAEDKKCDELDGEATRILIIGNSYVDQNNLPKMLKNIACSKDIATRIFKQTKHNYRFQDHAQDESTDQLIKLMDWDVVILQNHGQVPSWEEDQLRNESLPHAQTLVDKIVANHSETKIIYLQTWGRRDGDQTNCASTPLVCDFQGHTEALAAGYQIYADETGGEVAWAGNAFLDIYQDEDSLISPDDLWLEDGAHPSATGSYLAASVLFAKIFSQTPEGAYSSVELTKAQRLYLQTVAAQVVGP